MSVRWRVAPEQVGIGFGHVDQLSEIIDAVAREGRYRLFPRPDDDEAAIFRIHIDTDFPQQVLVLAEHFGDPAECEDVAYPSHGQAA